MKKKLSLIIPLLAIFCLISGGYALLSNNMIADDNSNYESPATITDSIPNTTTITKIENNDIAEKNTEDNIIETTKQKSSKQITTNNTNETELNYTDEWIINSPEGTSYESPGPKPDHYRIPDGLLAKTDREVYAAMINPTLMTPELYQRYQEINSQYEEFCKAMDNSIYMPNNEQPETSTPNNNQEINNPDVNNQVPNNEQPEIPTPDNNQEINFHATEYSYSYRI